MKTLQRVAVRLFCASLLVVAGACTSQNEPELVRVKIHGLQLIPRSGQVAVVLVDDSGTRFLPIVVERSQALSIQLSREGESPPRPLSHDLMARFLKALDAEVEQVTITALKGNTYYAEIILRHGEKDERIDARPSDAIPLALRTNAPIFATATLLSESPRELPEESGESGVTSEAWGLSVQDLTGELALYFHELEGVLIADVESGSPAARAGLQPGDVLIRLGDDRVRDASDFQSVLSKLEGEKRAQAVVVRDEETVTLLLER